LPLRTLSYKALSMVEHNPSLETLQDIKRMMERSSRVISLSGWSGIAAGICALIGAWFAYQKIEDYKSGSGRDLSGDGVSLIDQLLLIAIVVLVAAVLFAFLFTWMRTKKNRVKIWEPAAIRLMWNTLIPLAVGGLCIWRVLQIGAFTLVAPLCLVFYGLALVNGSKYTVGEVRYLGYGQILLGLLNLWLEGYGLYFWALGFGVLHILYGALMWWKYER
jgi:hypothetical protein